MATVGGGETEKAYLSIGAESWRGLRDCGEALTELAGRLPAANSSLAHTIVKLATRMGTEAPSLLADLMASLKHSEVVESDGKVCHPYVLGESTCGQLINASSNRMSEAWRTYAEVGVRGWGRGVRGGQMQRWA